MQSTIELYQQYLKITIEGAPSLRALLAVVDRAHATTQESRSSGLLVDMLKITRVPSGLEAGLFGEHIASRLSHVRKIALVLDNAPPDVAIDKIARRHGANLHSFADLPTAQQWLSAGSAGSPEPAQGT